MLSPCQSFLQDLYGYHHHRHHTDCTCRNVVQPRYRDENATSVAANVYCHRHFSKSACSAGCCSNGRGCTVQVSKQAVKYKDVKYTIVAVAETAELPTARDILCYSNIFYHHAPQIVANHVHLPATRTRDMIDFASIV